MYIISIIITTTTTTTTMAYTAAFPQWLCLLKSELLVHPIYRRTGHQHQGDSPTLFKKCCGFLLIPHWVRAGWKNVNTG